MKQIKKQSINSLELNSYCLTEYNENIVYKSKGSELIDGRSDAFDHFAEMEWLGADGQFSKDNSPTSFIRERPEEQPLSIMEEELLLSLTSQSEQTRSSADLVEAGFRRFVSHYRERSHRFSMSIHHARDALPTRIYKEEYVQYAAPRSSKQTYSKAVSMSTYYYLADLFTREKVLARLAPAIAVQKIQGTRCLPFIGYEILPEGFMTEPIFQVSEYNNAIVRKNALYKFNAMSKTKTAVTFYAGGGGQLLQMSNHYTQIVVLMTSDFDCQAAVKRYSGFSHVRERSQVQIAMLRMTYSELLKLSPSKLKSMLSTLINPATSFFLHDFHPELERFSSIFLSSYGVYHLFDEEFGWEEGALPPKLKDCDKDSAMLTKLLLKISPRMKPIYDPQRSEVACYAQHAVFRDRVIETDDNFSPSSVKVRIVDFAGGDTGASTRMKVVFTLPGSGCNIPVQLNFEFDPTRRLVPNFPVMVGRKVYFPAVALHREMIKISPVSLKSSDKNRFYMGFYTYFVVGSLRYYVDYDRPDLLLLDKWNRMQTWGFLVPKPSDVPIWDFNYSVNPYVKGSINKFTQVVGPHTFGPLVTLVKSIILSPPSLLEIKGVGVSKHDELVKDPRSSLKIAIGGPERYGSIAPRLYAMNVGYTKRMKPEVRSYCGGVVLATISESRDPVTIDNILGGVHPPMHDHLTSLFRQSFELYSHPTPRFKESEVDDVESSEDINDEM